ncbi:hypothetical protein ES703_99318 [subsurface metagenome]
MAKKPVADMKQSYPIYVRLGVIGALLINIALFALAPRSMNVKPYQTSQKRVIIAEEIPVATMVGSTSPAIATAANALIIPVTVPRNPKIGPKVDAMAIHNIPRSRKPSSTAPAAAIASSTNSRPSLTLTYCSCWCCRAGLSGSWDVVDRQLASCLYTA